MEPNTDTSASSEAIFLTGVISHVAVGKGGTNYAFIDPNSLRMSAEEDNPSLEDFLAELGLDMSQVSRIFLHSADVEGGKLIRGYRALFVLANTEKGPRALFAVVDDKSDLAWLAAHPESKPRAPKPEHKEKEPAQPLNSKESVQQAKKKHRRRGKGKGVNAPAPATAPIAAKAAVEQKPKQPAQHAASASKEQPVVTIPQPPRDSRPATESAPKGGSIFGAVAKSLFSLAKGALHK
ncbi:hypothetical protein FJY94_02220 [Candidatus Kaiserbacteria bacterium]|nr:hypothetical protein [Candidatus Kaiserbacteria bacterium]